MKNLNKVVGATAAQLPSLRIRNPIFMSKKANGAQITLLSHGTPTIFAELPTGGSMFMFSGEMDLDELDVVGTASDVLIITGA